MAKDSMERRTYRKSPGRQYESDYDPMRGQSRSGRLNNSTTTGGSRGTGRGDVAPNSFHRSGTLLVQRPDPRRTRQLMRQSIIASKNHTGFPDEEEQYDDDLRAARETGNSRRGVPFQEETDDFDDHAASTVIEQRQFGAGSRGNRPTRRPEQFIEPQQEDWEAMEDVDPDRGYEGGYEDEDPLAHRSLRVPSRRLQDDYPAYQQSRRAAVEPVEYDEADEVYDDAYDDGYDDEEEEEERPRRKRKKKGLSRRKLLLGLGVAAAGGVAAYELVPKIPQALNDVGTNIEHQLQDAYNRGIAAGGEAVRKELINSLDTLEGVSLEGAIGAAKLTRVAYDVFVSPIVTLAATVAGDFLNVTLSALITGRSWLAAIKQDNSTLAALQTVLETWVKQVTQMPKQVQSITDADLDGAQSYLRALERKIQEEQAKLNAPQSTQPTATPGKSSGTPNSAKPTGTPRH